MGKKIFAVAALSLLTVIGCSRQETRQTVENTGTATTTVANAGNEDDTAVPWRKAPVDPQAIERERFDEQWRGLEGFRAVPGAAQSAQAPTVNVRFAPNGREFRSESNRWM